ncbi:MAG: hypothetical protein LC803_08865 [Acidobacteria bacterium]|nr:hypothetical protein [Acidobacteriota bacterium]
MAITTYFLERLETYLAGRSETECLDHLPGDKYHLGVLAPWRNTGDAMSQPDETVEGDDKAPDADDESSAGGNIPVAARTSSNSSTSGDAATSDKDEQPDIENEDAERLNHEDILNRRGAPSALGVEFMVSLPEDGTVRLNFDVRFSIYTRRFPNWGQQIRQGQGNGITPSVAGRGAISIRDRYVRHDIVLEPIPIELRADRKLELVKDPFAAKINEILDAEKKLPDVWRKLARSTVASSSLNNESSYNQAIAKLRNHEIDLPPLSAYLDIRTAAMQGNKLRIGAYVVNGTPAEKTTSANAARFLIDVQIICRLESGEFVPVEIVSAPKDYQYDPRIWAIGQGCAVDVDLNQSTIRTQGLAKYDQPRLTTKDDPPALFDVLKTDPIPLLREIHTRMSNYAADWEQKLRSHELGLDGAELESCQDDLAEFEAEINRYLAGVDALEKDPRLLEAFRRMHRVFERAGAPRGIDRWRLFQLGFIVTQLVSLAVREKTVASETLDYADVLWFPTGGGKTEAYLGLIACALLYDRLRGKTAGVTAWLRFPLRMLSVQQLQRAVRVLYETEQERQALLGDQAENSDPITLGYFVGKGSTPNQLANTSWAGQWKLSELTARKELRDKLRLTRVCPRCSESKVEVEVDTLQLRIRHVCQGCRLDLNIYVSDDEIYRYLPSVLIGTVDKLASVAWRQQFSHLWGGAGWRCPKHGYASGRYCIVFGCDVKEADRGSSQLHDPVPALQIQDELHLLREELGTFAGHYETLSVACEKRSWLPSKILAATATVEGVDRQTRHLYGLRARRFPSRGYKLGESFYTQYAREGDTVKVARRYVAFRSQFLRSPDASMRVLSFLHEEIRNIYQQLKDQGPTSVAARVGLYDAKNEAEVLALLNYYDTTLTYVGSKPDGGRIKRSLDDSISQQVPRIGTRQIESVYLSSNSTMDQIADAVDRLERPPTDAADPKRIDAVVGTSLISHGVDVSRFNLMVMSGMPGRTAEYIQSSSRSGRQYVGIIVVALSPWLLRDQSLYHRFIPYHQNMDRLVEPVPINRFSRFAVERTMPGMLAGMLNAYWAPEIGKDLARVNAVTRALDDGLLTENDLCNRMLEAFAVGNVVYSPGLLAALEERVRERFRVEMRSLRAPGSADRVPDALTRKPMSSLRDVDDPVPFDARENTWLMLRWIDRQ